jgi:DNA-binding NarL/FixJ family response regulator
MTLTPRQRQIMTMIVDGWKDREICRELKLSDSMVKFHIHQAVKRLGCVSRVTAAIAFVSNKNPGP